MNRLLKAGAYFVRPVYKREDEQEKIWKGRQARSLTDLLARNFLRATFLRSKHVEYLKCAEMENLTSRLCWDQVGKDGQIAVWRKPLNNSCYEDRSGDEGPALCEENVVSVNVS